MSCADRPAALDLNPYRTCAVYGDNNTIHGLRSASLFCAVLQSFSYGSAPTYRINRDGTEGIVKKAPSVITLLSRKSCVAESQMALPSLQQKKWGNFNLQF